MIAQPPKPHGMGPEAGAVPDRHVADPDGPIITVVKSLFG